MGESLSFREVISKASVANIVAGIVILGAVFYGIYYQNVELIKSLALFGCGYLFGRSARG